MGTKTNSTNNLISNNIFYHKKINRLDNLMSEDNLSKLIRNTTLSPILDIDNNILSSFIEKKYRKILKIFIDAGFDITNQEMVNIIAYKLVSLLNKYRIFFRKNKIMAVDKLRAYIIENLFYFMKKISSGELYNNLKNEIYNPISKYSNYSFLHENRNARSSRPKTNESSHNCANCNSLSK